MNRLSLFAFLSFATIILISCSKEKDVKPVDIQKISLIQKHTWVLDSTNTITASYNVMQPEIPSSQYIFSEDSMTINFHGTQLIEYGILYEAPDKIYFWFAGEMKNINEYAKIESVNDSSLIAKEIDVLGERTRVRYYHAQ